jgi:hypothetical protein
MKQLSKKHTGNDHGAKPAQQATIELVATVRESVPVPFYEKIQSSITWNLPHLHPDDYFVPEDLVGIGLWCDLTDDEKRMAKACIAHLSETKVLPICTRDAKLDYPHFYVVA